MMRRAEREKKDEKKRVRVFVLAWYVVVGGGRGGG